MTASEVLQHLYLLNTSSPDFLRVLYGLIRYDEDEQYSSTLEGAELARLVDFLDDALCSIHTSDDVFRRCLRKLRAICGCHSILPSSHIIRGDLKRIGDGAIAFGGFADVWQGSHDGKRVCIKVLRISLNDDEFLTKSFYKEAVVWKRLTHPNVVPFLGVAHKPLQFVSEWMPNGTITRYVRDNPGADRINLLLDVAEGLNYLHTSYTIHGDLKGPNIIVNHDGHACLTDFGLASISHGINSIRVTHAHGHTPRWTAPEILKGAEEITREADIFSFGMVVIEVFTGRHPFNDSIATSVTFKIMDGERPARPQGTQELGLVDPVWGMTVNCWQQEPTHRPIMAAVVGFLRECYTLRDKDPSLSTLAPWQPTGNGGDTTTLSPMSIDGFPSPTQSSRTSQHSGHSYFQTQEASATSKYNNLFSGASHSSHSSLSEPFSDESHPHSNSATYAVSGHDGSTTSTGTVGQGRVSTQRDIDGRRQPVWSATFGEMKPTISLHEIHRTSSLPTREDGRPAQHFGLGFNHGIGSASPKHDSRKKDKNSPRTGKGRWQIIRAIIMFRVSPKRPKTEGQDGG